MMTPTNKELLQINLVILCSKLVKNLLKLIIFQSKLVKSPLKLVNIAANLVKRLNFHKKNEYPFPWMLASLLIHS
jgi:hypothetical protein